MLRHFHAPVFIFLSIDVLFSERARVHTLHLRCRVRVEVGIPCFTCGVGRVNEWVWRLSGFEVVVDNPEEGAASLGRRDGNWLKEVVELEASVSIEVCGTNALWKEMVS